jgi:hypothetical protein
MKESRADAVRDTFAILTDAKRVWGAGKGKPGDSVDHLIEEAIEDVQPQLIIAAMAGLLARLMTEEDIARLALHYADVTDQEPP